MAEISFLVKTLHTILNKLYHMKLNVMFYEGKNSVTISHIKLILLSAVNNNLLKFHVNIVITVNWHRNP
jgi:hypothetical protein